MSKVAVIQSNYIPWKGYFDIIHDVDLFVFYDDVQFTKNDWRNRNKIKAPSGAMWLTVPVGADIQRLICEVGITDSRWALKHWKSICQYYSKAPFFDSYKGVFEEIYLQRQWQNLSELNQHLVKVIARECLGISTEFRDSREFSSEGTRLDRLLDLLQKTGASEYVSGPAAKGYIEESRFAEAGIALTFKDYSGYPEYPQFFPPFDPYVSIVDLLFQVGPEAPRYIWEWRHGEKNTPGDG